MTQSLKPYEGIHIRINLLDVAKDFIKASEPGIEEYTFSYRIDFDSYFNDENNLQSEPLFISKE